MGRESIISGCELASPQSGEAFDCTTVCDNQLPQGSPTSQAIGNQVLVHFGPPIEPPIELEWPKFSMYGDEFTLSGRRRVKRLKGLTIRIVEQEGFRTNPTKVKDLDRSERQEIAGIIVNKKPSLGRTTTKSSVRSYATALNMAPHHRIPSAVQTS